jgi:hypothetical protein
MQAGWLMLGLLLAQVSAAPRPKPVRPAEGSRQASAAETRLDGLLQGLRSPEPAVVEQAEKALLGSRREELPAPAASRLLRAATGRFPERKRDFQSTPVSLVRAAALYPAAALIPVVAEVFPALEPRAQAEALVLLMKLPEKAAARMVVKLLRDGRAAGRPVPAFRTEPLRREVRHADVYFPALLDFAAAPNTFEVYAALLKACQEEALTTSQLALLAGQVLEAWRPLRDRARAAQALAGGAPGWQWEEAYQEAREEAGLLLDVLGHLPGARVSAEVRGGLGLDDPKLQLFASTGLLRRGEEVPAAVLEKVAASAEQRNWLYRALKAQGLEARFPARWHTQEAFAEGELVGWLAYPTELGRPPDELELMQVVAETVPGKGRHEWYLFRFRTRPPHWSAKKGWMAGVAGPFRRAESPSPNAHGDTFSSFTPWDSKPPGAHVADLRGVIAGWQARQAKEEKE